MRSFPFRRRGNAFVGRAVATVVASVLSLSLALAMAVVTAPDAVGAAQSTDPTTVPAEETTSSVEAGEEAPDTESAPEDPPADAPVLTDAEEEPPVAFESVERVSSANILFTGTPRSANARWLVNLYTNVFQRPADVDGLDHWLALVPGGGERSRSLVADSFLTSREGARGEAVRAYDDILRRSPDAGGLEFWTDYLRTAPVTSLRFQLYNSDEYYATAGGSNRAFVRALYNDILFREPDSGGLAYWSGRLDAGAARWTISANIYWSDESLDHRVTAYFEEILGRAPISAELVSGRRLIRSNDERALRSLLLASDEAFEPYVVAALDD